MWSETAECSGGVCYDPDPADRGNVQQSGSLETVLPKDARRQTGGLIARMGAILVVAGMSNQNCILLIT